MSNIYNWIITRLDCYPNQDGYENVVSTIYWSRQVKDADARSVSINGAMGISFNNHNAFTPYSSLTLEQITLWVEANMGTKGVSDLDAALEIEIQNQINPPIVSLPLPWVTEQTNISTGDLLQTQNETILE